MSNIAGKAYGMNVITPMRWWTTLWQIAVFKYLSFFTGPLKGLLNLSLIHYARWTIIKRQQFPRLSNNQPEETLCYNYMLFESNFNGSWDQYIDSFSFAIPTGLDKVWKWNIRYPTSIPLHPFYQYIRYNQIDTDHYYTAYPCASANDVKAAKLLTKDLRQLERKMANLTVDDFAKAYNELLLNNQNRLGRMDVTPVVSMAHNKVTERLSTNCQDEENETHVAG